MEFYLAYQHKYGINKEFYKQLISLTTNMRKELKNQIVQEIHCKPFDVTKGEET